MLVRFQQGTHSSSLIILPASASAHALPCLQQPVFLSLNRAHRAIFLLVETPFFPGADRFIALARARLYLFNGQFLQFSLDADRSSSALLLDEQDGLTHLGSSERRDA